MTILPQLIVNSLVAGSIYALIALGFNLIFNVARFYNIAHGSMIAVGGYLVYFFYTAQQINLYLAVGLAIVISGGLGVLFEKTVFRPLRTRKAKAAVMLIASLGLFTLMQAIIAVLFTNRFHSLDQGRLSRIYHLAGGVLTQTQLAIIVSALALLAITGLILKFTLLGKQIRAVSDDEEVAKIVGIDTNKIIAWVFVAGSAMAGYAGILVGFDTGIVPTMGLPLLLSGITAAIIGGAGNIYGGYVGALLIGAAENFGIWKLPGEWKAAIAFGLLILFLIFRPQGLFKK